MEASNSHWTPRGKRASGGLPPIVGSHTRKNRGTGARFPNWADLEKSLCPFDRPLPRIVRLR
jgi:hypothetical protein